MTHERRPESQEERASRVSREAAELALARRHAEAGELISGPELDALLDSLDTDAPLPTTQTGD
jgi:hypothetical protein